MRDYDEGYDSFEIKGPGLVTIKVYGESCEALKKKPETCYCYGMGDTEGILRLPMSYKLTAEFKCKPDKTRR